MSDNTSSVYIIVHIIPSLIQLTESKMRQSDFLRLYYFDSYNYKDYFQIVPLFVFPGVVVKSGL